MVRDEKCTMSSLFVAEVEGVEGEENIIHHGCSSVHKGQSCT